MIIIYTTISKIQILQFVFAQVEETYYTKWSVLKYLFQTKPHKMPFSIYNISFGNILHHIELIERLYFNRTINTPVESD